MVFKSKIKLVALVGLALSFLSLATHFSLARYFGGVLVESRPDFRAIVLSWSNPEGPSHATVNFGIWRPVSALKFLRPYDSARGVYSGPNEINNGFIFVRIKGEFHEIRSSICDVVVVARLLNATLVLPELQEVVMAKGVSSMFKEFGYIYDEQHFMSALAKDVVIVKNLPQELKRVKQDKMVVFKSPRSTASPRFYFEEVLPVLKVQGIIGLVISRGGCLQSLLPPNLSEYQRLRCRVAFEALQFRREVQELGFQMVRRLQALGQPYLAFHPGLELGALVYHGCAEQYQDIHTELIQHKRALMIKKGLIKGELHIDSQLQWRNGSCPLMPEEVGILLRALGYGPHTRIYISGVEVFGGQRSILPLRAMFINLEDRMTLTAKEERSAMFGPEKPLPVSPPPPLVVENEKARLEAWARDGPRPRPLPPPPSRQKIIHEVDGWWGWVGEAKKESEATPLDLRERGHKLLLTALDYIVCVESNAFFPGFDRDKNGLPNFASLVMGHRAYKSASLKTYRPNRKYIVKLIEEISEQLYHPTRKWVVSVQNHLKESLGEAGLIEFSRNSKPLSFLSHPLPECSCRLPEKNKTLNKHSKTQASSGRILYGDEEICPDWMQHETTSITENLDNLKDYYLGQSEADMFELDLLAEKPMVLDSDKLEKEDGHLHDVDEETESED